MCLIQAIFSSPFCRCDLPKFPQTCLYNGHILLSHLLKRSPQADSFTLKMEAVYFSEMSEHTFAIQYEKWKHDHHLNSNFSWKTKNQYHNILYNVKYLIIFWHVPSVLLLSIFTAFIFSFLYLWNTGSFFDLTTIICHFLLLLFHVCWRSALWAMLMRKTNQQEVTADSCQIK